MSFLHRLSRHATSNKKDWLFLLPSLLMLAFFGLPIISLVLRAVGMDFFTYAISTQALIALRLSLVTSTLSVLLAIALGMPLAYVLARWKFPGKSILELLVDLPVVLPPAVAGLALLMAFGRTGVMGKWLNLIGITLPFTTTAVVMAEAFVASPLFIRSARVGFAEIDPRLEEAAWVEGGTEWQVFRYVMLPLAWRGLLSGIILAWTRSLGEFGATILFAGNMQGKTQTMPLAIYLGLERGLGVALALSLLLVLVSIIVLGVMRRIEKEGSVTTFQ
jgi:molybdate transport system permease protein